MNQDIEFFTVIIPSLDPNQDLLLYIDSLITVGFKRILVINDGSSDEHNYIFKAISKMKYCVVLCHPENKGKGEALKTGYAYVKENTPDCKGIVTADSDGQHAVNNAYEVAEAIIRSPNSLVLGVRDFSKKNTPFKSLLGNRLTSAVMFILFGKWLSDTQTGLRGFSSCLIDKMMKIKGQRYEYEMQVLIDFIWNKYQIFQVEIETIYENNNQGTHFRVVWDTLRIFKVMISNFLIFFSSSILSALVDLSLAWLLLFMLKNKLSGSDFLRIAIATALARIASIGVNYLLNKNYVFRSSGNYDKSLERYLLLGLMVMALSALSVYFLHINFGMDEMISKLITDSMLFFLSYHIQKNWVFQIQEGIRT
ncbi:MAG: GtrA family protein [Acetobacterium sp.]